MATLETGDAIFVYEDGWGIIITPTDGANKPFVSLSWKETNALGGWLWEQILISDLLARRDRKVVNDDKEGE